MREKLIDLLCKYSLKKQWILSVGDLASFLIDNGVTIQKWIPVTERLPKKEGRYLCVVPIGKSGAVYVQVMNGDRHGFSLEHIYNDDVTHWMPLPAPPKGE